MVREELPCDYPAFDPVTLDYDFEGAAVSPKAARYGFKFYRFDIALWQPSCYLLQFQPQGLLLEREEPTAAKSLSQCSHPHDTESCSFQRVSKCQ
jgi:hypothetical protein